MYTMETKQIFDAQNTSSLRSDFRHSMYAQAGNPKKGGTTKKDSEIQMQNVVIYLRATTLELLL